MADLAISTWFVGDKLDEATSFPQMEGAGQSFSLSFQRTYWECIWLFFRTATFFHPEAERVLFVNDAAHPLMAEFGQSLAKLDVKIVELPFTSRPPHGFTPSFGNQLYIVDIIRWLASGSAQSSENWLVLDSDCIFVSKLEGFVDDLRGHRILTLDLHSGPNERINGLTEEQLGEVARRLRWWGGGGKVAYYGGEFFAANGVILPELSKMMSSMLRDAFHAFSESQASIREEAHLLSIAYARLGIAGGTANRYIKRIWTTLRVRNGCKGDLRVPVWHVPAEKRTGLHRLYILAQKRPDHFDRIFSAPDCPRLVGKWVGVPTLTLGKQLRDLFAKLWSKTLG